MANKKRDPLEIIQEIALLMEYQLTWNKYHATFNFMEDQLKAYGNNLVPQQIDLAYNAYLSNTIAKFMNELYYNDDE